MIHKANTTKHQTPLSFIIPEHLKDHPSCHPAELHCATSSAFTLDEIPVSSSWESWGFHGRWNPKLKFNTWNGPEFFWLSKRRPSFFGAFSRFHLKLQAVLCLLHELGAHVWDQNFVTPAGASLLSNLHPCQLSRWCSVSFESVPYHFQRSKVEASGNQERR